MELFFQSESFIVALIASGSALFGVLVSQGIGFWKLKSEHKYERQIFLRQKYEELAFRLIEFTNILKVLNSKLSQELGESDINTDEFYRKGAKIEILTVLYFPELSTDCECFLAISHQFLLSHSPNNNSSSINNRESMRMKFDEGFDQLYDKIKEHILDYT